MAVTEPYTDTPESGNHADGVAPELEAAIDPATNGRPDGAGEDDAEVAPGPWLYADKALAPNDDDPALDTLSFGAYADALAFLMDRKTTYTPLTIAINGPWGWGKTSLARMAEDRLTDGSDWNTPHVVCRFDAWANDDAPHLGAAFAAAVAKQVNRERGCRMRLLAPLPSSMLSPDQRWRRRLWLMALTVLIAAAATFWPTGRSLFTPLLHLGATVATLKHGATAARLSFALLVVVVVLAQKLWPGLQAVARWVDEPRSEAAQGSMHDAKAQLGGFIRQALRGKRRLMIFVDNLERCRPPRALEVCEVVSQLIGHKDVVTVLIGDMDTIALSAASRDVVVLAVRSNTRRWSPFPARPGYRDPAAGREWAAGCRPAHMDVLTWRSSFRFS